MKRLPPPTPEEEQRYKEQRDLVLRARMRFFDALYALAGRRVLRVATNWARGTGAQGEDVAQWLWLRLLRSATLLELDSLDRLFAYATRALKNLTIRVAGEGKREAPTDDELLIERSLSTSPSPESRERFATLWRSLSPEERQHVVMRSVCGMDHADIARELGITTAAARQRWCALMRSLRIEENEGTP
jgi:RNA polymerase sigma factor (sigma-70 family)